MSNNTEIKKKLKRTHGTVWHAWTPAFLRADSVEQVGSLEVVCNLQTRRPSSLAEWIHSAHLSSLSKHSLIFHPV